EHHTGGAVGSSGALNRVRRKGVSPGLGERGKKAPVAVPAWLVRGCDEDNHRDRSGGAESRDFPVGGSLPLGWWACDGRATPWRSTYRQYSNRVERNVAGFAGGASIADRSCRPRLV